MQNSSGEELRKCSKCCCTMVRDGNFAINKKNEYYKCCKKCTEKMRLKRMDPEYKAKQKTLRKNHYENNKERLKEEGKQYRDANKEKIAEYHRDYYKKNKETVNEKNKMYYQNHKEQVLERTTAYQKNHPEVNRASATKWRENNRDKVRAYQNNRRATNINVRITDNLRGRLWSALKGKSKCGSTKDLLGCSIPFLKGYLAAKFEDGMSWDTYSFETFHIDHIIPCSSFDLSDPEQQKKCFHYTNLQPLWAFDNMSKGNKLDWSKDEL